MIKYFQSGSRMSQAVVYGGLVHIAGQVADDRKAGIESQTSDVLAKVEALLAEAGSSKSKLVAVNIFLPQIGDFEAMNSIYDAWSIPHGCLRAPASRRGLPILIFASRSPRSRPSEVLPCIRASSTRSISTATARHPVI